MSRAKRTNRGLAWIATTLLTVAPMQSAAADPCGMVPPIWTGAGAPITRVGAQMTYVFYKDGIESTVLRPGFEGKVDQFGMLIPFPSPPEIRKVSDEIFPHIGAAVDPTPVVVDLTRYYRAFSVGRASLVEESGDELKRVRKDEVRVIREEAVGMYQVAVLAAGGAAALEKWMTEHGFQYPVGMDEVCEDYVRDEWCFVAVKARVGNKSASEPRPGMRDVDVSLAPDEGFDGHVQAMGFRFATDEMVVPMRLSAFNPGELRNVVYVLADGPRKIAGIPSSYVVRQVAGRELVKNLTADRPIQVIGGTRADAEAAGWFTNLDRRPGPVNGLARELFLSDLLAAREASLALPFEEREKRLLEIGEELGLRGKELDAIVRSELALEREETVSGLIDELADMTLTVVDGDFPREILAAANLEFPAYTMPDARNSIERYDARSLEKKGSVGFLDIGDVPTLPRGLGFVAALLLGVALIARPRSLRKLRAPVAGAVLLAGGLAFAPRAVAQEPEDDPNWVRLLGDAERGDEAVAALSAKGDSFVQPIAQVVRLDSDLERRGWAVVCLSRIGSGKARKELEALSTDGKLPVLVRTWSGAALVQLAGDFKELQRLAGSLGAQPALARPIAARWLEFLDADGSVESLEAVLETSASFPQVATKLLPRLTSEGPDRLVDVMVSGKSDAARRQAAALLATLGAQGQADVVAEAVIDVYDLDHEARQVKWHGGALYVPGIQWSAKDSRALVRNLLRWYLWVELRELNDQRQQIENNIRSWALLQSSGLIDGGWPANGLDAWLLHWGKAMGLLEVTDLLKEQGVENEPRFQKILNQLRSR